MKYRFVISIDGGVNYDVPVDPSGVPENLVEWERDTSNGRASKRMVIGGPLTFSGADFRYFQSLDTDTAHCEPIYIQVQLRCRAQWRVLWTGRFPKGGGSWDLDRCTWVISPDPIDRFTCLEEGWEVKRNILNTPVVDVNIVNFPTGMEIMLNANGAQETFGKWTDTGETQSVTYPAGMGTCSGTTFSATIFWRETSITDCVGGVAVPPPGSGWLALSDSFGGFSGPNFGCDDHGKVKWARSPLTPWPFPSGAIVEGPSGGGEPSSPTCANWYQFGTLNCVGGFFSGLFLCLEQATVTETIDTARKIEDALVYLLEQLDCDIAGVRSDFFEWNPPGDAPGYSSGINYVTGEINQHSNLLFLQKSDAVDAGAGEPATKGETTLKEMLRHFATMYQVFWEIDADGYLRLEHYSYFYTQPGVDTSAYDTVERQAYESLNNEVPRIERASFPEALGDDFVGKDIVYSGPCVASGGDKEIEYGTGDVMTDISMILSAPTSVSRKGFVWLATTFNGSDYDVIVDFGEISGSPTTNAPLSWANLQRDFWTWNRYLPSANMNGIDTVFDGFRANVQQQSITVKCFDCDALTFDGDQTVATRLGDYFGGIRGQVEKASLDRSGNLKLTLRYSR
jgi:hypothetical protein